MTKRIVRFRLAALLTSFGWGFAWYLNERGYNTVFEYQFLRPWLPPADAWMVLTHLITWLGGGCITALMLRFTNPHITFHHIFLIVAGWTVSGFIWSGDPFPSPPPPGHGYWPETWQIGIGIGSFVMALVIFHTHPNLRWWSFVVIVVSWIGARYIVAFDAGIIRPHAVLDPLYRRLALSLYWDQSVQASSQWIYHAQPILRGAIFGAIGAIPMYLTLALSKGEEADTRGSQTGVSKLVHDLHASPVTRTLAGFAAQGKTKASLIRMSLTMLTILVITSALSSQPPALYAPDYSAIPLVLLMIPSIITPVAVSIISSRYAMLHASKDHLELIQVSGTSQAEIASGLFWATMYRFRHVLFLQSFLYVVVLPFTLQGRLTFSWWTAIANFAMLVFNSVGIILGVLGLCVLGTVLSIVLLMPRRHELTTVFSASVILLIAAGMTLLVLTPVLQLTWFGPFPRMTEISALVLFLSMPYLAGNEILHHKFVHSGLENLIGSA